MAAMQAESGRDLEEEDRALVAELAHRAALALDNARLYADAEAARRQAEAANRAKDEFLAMLGHELRNPLAPIVTALSLMARRGDTAHARERQIIERQVAHLLRLVDDLLDVSRITQGKVQLQRERVDMKAVVARAVELTEPVFERRERPIELQLPQARAHVIGDPVRLAQVLSNLLTNAAKFTPPSGVIALRMTVSGGQVEVEVADTGSGIAPDLLPRVFDLFSQGDQPIDRTSGGLGLGLAIVRTLAQMHGGSVRAASDGPGRGSRFTVSLPLADPHGEITPEPEPRETSPGNGSVLVVDDNADAAETLALLLEQAGYVVQIAGDGGEALRLLDHFEPALALLDLGLPTMDGHELARRLRADPRTAHMRLAALTGYGGAGDRARTSLHFDEHLVKPVAADVLLEAVARLLHAGPREVDAPG
jgi:signal transduction histidine kinase/CheY-like chemotaxis protein